MLVREGEISQNCLPMYMGKKKVMQYIEWQYWVYFKNGGENITVQNDQDGYLREMKFEDKSLSLPFFFFY